MGKAASAIRSQAERLRALERFLDRVRQRVNVIQVYIVGSRARGDYLEDSDLDVVLVVDDSVKDLNQAERLSMIRDFLEPGVDCRVYALSEWSQERSLWIRELKREAVPLDKFVEMVREAERALRERSRQLPSGRL